MLTRLFCTLRRHPKPTLRTVGTCPCGAKLYYWRLA